MKLGPALNEAFGKAYVLSLKRSIDRRAYISDNCNAIGLDFEFIDAIEGKYFMNNTYYTRDGHMNTYILPVATTAAYYAAQIAIEYQIHKALSDGLQSFIFMNDDVYFDNYQNFMQNDFLDIKMRLPSDWDIIILGNIHTAVSSTPVQYYLTTHHTPGCHAIAINHTAYHDYILEGSKREMVGDHLIDRLRERGKRIYHLYPDICLQNREFITTCL